MTKRLTVGVATIFAALSLLAVTAVPAAADPFDDHDGDWFDYAHEMATGGYAEIEEGFENGEFQLPYDDVDDEDDEDDDE